LDAFGTTQVIPNGVTSTTHERYRLRHSWDLLLVAEELPTFRLYDLRHSYASLEAAAATPIEVVSKRMGHNSIVLTVDTYGHMFE
jgi:integrase